MMTQGFTLVVLHETVHALQLQVHDTCCTTLLENALHEGVADFLGELASGSSLATTPYHQYGRTHEAAVWAEFSRDMGSAATIPTWIASWGVAGNHGAPDLGYWVGYRIAQAFYRQAPDKRAAVAALIRLDDPGRILRESGYDPTVR